MRNADSNQEHDGTPRVRRCGYCGEPLLAQRRGAKFCSREHKELARQRRQRAGERLTTLRGRHPFPDPPDLREHSDELDLGPDEQDDEQGIVGGDPGRYDPEGAWVQRMAYADAIDAIQQRYERLLAPYREVMKRNIGVKPVAVARLEAARDLEISELTRQHQKQEALERAAHMAPQRAATAHERAVERGAARALQSDLGRGRHLRDDPANVGRATRDIAIW